MAWRGASSRTAPTVLPVGRVLLEEHLRRRLAKNTRRLRMEAGMTVEQLAERACMAPRHLQKVEAAEVGATLRTLAKLGGALGVDPSDLIAPSASSRRGV